MSNSTFRLGLAACAVVFGLGGHSAANAESVFEACSEEATTLCANVVPGHGHLYACLYANEEKMSDRCDAATADVLDQMDLFFELVRYTKQECLIDIEKHCSGVDMGGGRILSCLTSNESDLSDACGAVVQRLTSPEE